MEFLLPLAALVAGYFVSLIQWYYPEKKLRLVCQSLLKKSQEDLKWAQAKIGTQKIDLERWEKKNWDWSKKSIEQLQEWPRANSYWTFEGPKLQQRVLDLEMELENLRSRTQWKD